MSEVPSSGPAGQLGEPLVSPVLRPPAQGEKENTLREALLALIEAIARDENGGGLLSRATIRQADEARLLLARTLAAADPPRDDGTTD